jgi:hypothetical protein
MTNKLVVHYADGRVVKGFASDLFANKESFHFVERDSDTSCTVSLEELKGVFFVKDFDGSPHRQRRSDLDRAGMGRRIEVDFLDGETLVGYTSGYSRDRLAFFVFPTDPDDNTERVLVINAATRDVRLV